MDVAEFHRAEQLRQQIGLFDAETIDEVLMATTDEIARETLEHARQQLPGYFRTVI